MKKLLSLLLLAMFWLTACAPKGPTALEFNDAIIGQQVKVIKGVLDFSNTIESGNTKDARAILKEVNLNIDSALIKVNALNADHLKEAKPFKESAIALFNYYKQTVNKDYTLMLDILDEIEGGNISRAENLDPIVERMKLEEEKFDKQFGEAQKAFATANDLTIQTNELQKDIDKMVPAE